MKKKAKTTSKVTKQPKWLPIPQKSFQEWFSEFMLSSLAVEFYGRNKKWPTKIYPDSLKVIEQKDGSAILSVDLE